VAGLATRGRPNFGYCAETGKNPTFGVVSVGRHASDFLLRPNVWLVSVPGDRNWWVSTSLGNSGLCWTVFARNRDTAVPAEGNGDLQTLICVLVARPRRCSTVSNPVPDKTEWRLISTTLCGWRRCFVADHAVMVHDTDPVFWDTVYKRLQKCWLNQQTDVNTQLMEYIIGSSCKYVWRMSICTVRRPSTSKMWELESWQHDHDENEQLKKH